MPEPKKITILVEPSTFKDWDDLRHRLGEKWQRLGMRMFSGWYASASVPKTEQVTGESAPAEQRGLSESEPDFLETEQALTDSELRLKSLVSQLPPSEKEWAERALLTLLSEDEHRKGILRFAIDYAHELPKRNATGTDPTI